MAENTTIDPTQASTAIPTGADVSVVSNPTEADSAVNPEGNSIISDNAPTPVTEEGDAGIIETPEDAQTAVIEKQQEAIKQTATTAAGLEAEETKRLAEEKKQLEDRTKAEADFKDKQDAIIKQKDTDIAAVQDEVDTLAEDRQTRDVDILKGEAGDQKRLNDQALALQKSKDEQAIRTAEREIEMNTQRSAWAFNKLGLAFSSGIILQSQQIADEGALRIATLKVQASFNQTKMQIEASKVQAEYTTQVNATIDKYTDIQLNNKQDIINRIDATNNNLLLSEKEKQAEINKLKDEYKSNTRTIEDNMKTEQERLADRGIGQAQDLETSLAKERASQLDVLNQDISTGNIVNMTASDIALKEQELGMSPGTINKTVDGSISTTLRNLYDSFLGPNIPIANINELTAETRKEMELGRSFNEAVQIVSERNIKSHPEFIRQEALRKAEADKATAAANKASGLSQFTSGVSANEDLSYASYRSLNPGEGSQVSRKDFEAATDAGKERIIKSAIAEQTARNKITAQKEAEAAAKATTDTKLSTSSLKSLQEYSPSEDDKKSVTDIITNIKNDGFSDADAIKLLQERNDELVTKEVAGKDSNGNSITKVTLVDSDLIFDDVIYEYIK